MPLIHALRRAHASVSLRIATRSRPAATVGAPSASPCSPREPASAVTGPVLHSPGGSVEFYRLPRRDRANPFLELHVPLALFFGALDFGALAPSCANHPLKTGRPCRERALKH
jgi:hypothetical protein